MGGQTTAQCWTYNHGETGAQEVRNPILHVLQNEENGLAFSGALPNVLKRYDTLTISHHSYIAIIHKYVGFIQQKVKQDIRHMGLSFKLHDSFTVIVLESQRFTCTNVVCSIMSMKLT